LYGFRSPRGRPGLSPWPPWTHLLEVKFSFRSWGLPRSPKGSFLSVFWEPFGSIFGGILGLFYVARGLGGDAIYTMFDGCVCGPRLKVNHCAVCMFVAILLPSQESLHQRVPLSINVYTDERLARSSTPMLHCLVLRRVRVASSPSLSLKKQACCMVLY